MRFLFFLGPFVFYAILFQRRREQMGDPLALGELDVEQHRSLALTLGGFSFSAALALLAFADGQPDKLEMPIYSAFMSFLLYVGSANLQAYKFNRGRDLLGDALRDSANLSLVLCLSYSLGLVELSPRLEIVLVIVGLGLWVLDLGVRLCLMDTYLQTKESSK